ncbi:HepT-like ribonuclease domain-containing protein [Ruficoccus sp. ZRK36]|uniref:HepT-like ribonuclease domain-containing protein n=1 Tax=Ruficoccus sp. ZRK36 TaxID=2866311 RepID=UPI001C72E49C|nr:HepT-like ribonuclease domain-containing protein [Ruficoccus sp. ZRK36]QYY35152.1 hypothetical protein K0V07_12705 [Ruficoccus sp. ZRK36]
MDTLTFISRIVNSLAWPLAVVIITYLFRRDFSALIKRVNAFKHRDTELRFREELEHAADKASGGHTNEKAFLQDPVSEKVFAILEISPGAAVISAWIEFENAAVEAIGAETPLAPHKLFAQLREAHLLDPNDYIFLQTLRRLRNAAVHDYDYLLDYETAYKACTALLALSWELKHKDLNNS